MRFYWCFGGGFLCAAVTTIFLLHPPYSSQDWAAWIQAIGSIGAIAGAFGVVYLQRKHAHEDASILRGRLEAATSGMFLQCTYEVTKATRRLRNYMAAYDATVTFSFNSRIFEELLDTVRKIPVADLPPKLMENTLDIQRILISSAEAAKRRNGERKKILPENLANAELRAVRSLEIHRAVREIVEQQVAALRGQ